MQLGVLFDPQLAGGALAGTMEDLQNILTKAPEYIADVSKILNKAGKYLPTLAHIAEDPSLPLVIAQVEHLYQVEKARKVKAAATPAAAQAAASSPQTGVGLEHVVAPLKAFTFVREHPWVPWVAGAGGIVLLLGVGVLIGRATKRTR